MVIAIAATARTGLGNGMKRFAAIVLGLCGLNLCSFAALAAEDASPAAAASADTDLMTRDEYDKRSRVALTHPNELWRLYGSNAAARGDWDDAFRHFRRAAGFADKYSQHRLSLMYWHGVGAPRDRALAYAWADLAAERQYPQFLVLREKMWLELNEAERERSLREGQALYDRYGDQVAKPRFERALAHSRRQITGSRLGDVGKLQVFAPGPTGWTDPGTVDLNQMLSSWRWDSGRYWAAEDVIWRHGNVEVGPTELAPRSQ